MITYRETKRMSLSHSSLQSLTGNAGEGEHETFFGANYLRLEPDDPSVDQDGC